MPSNWQEEPVHIYRLENNGRRLRYCDNREIESVQDLPVMAYRSGSYKKTHGFTPSDLCIFCIDKAIYVEPCPIATVRAGADAPAVCTVGAEV